MNLENLSKIKPVEAPPFLFTRIQNKIEQQKKESMPDGIVWAAAFSLVVVVSLNVYVVVKSISTKNNIQTYASSIQLISDNSLYQ